MKIPFCYSARLSFSFALTNLLQLNANLLIADKMGNTALMYAVLYSNSSLVNFISDTLFRKSCIEAFRAKNLLGETAEILARKNEKFLLSMWVYLLTNRCFLYSLVTLKVLD